MDVALLYHELDELIRARKKANTRYRGLAFSATSQEGLLQLKQKLLQILSPITVWTYLEQGDAAGLRMSRINFCDAAFKERHPDGLLIYLPEDWMVDWPSSEKRVFWSRLSDTYGINDVYVVFAGTPSNIQDVNSYLVPHGLKNLPVSVWSSKYEQ